MTPASTRLAALLLCASATALCSQSGAAQTLVLGDSLSDTGNAFRLTGGTFPDPQFYKDGRLSNGPIWADRLVPRQGYYADLLTGQPTTGPLDGWNFAVAGALTNSDELDPATMRAPGLLTQVRDYRNFISAGLIAPGSRATSAIIWSGANDYGMRATDPTRAVAGDAAFVDTVVGNLKTATGQLVSSGLGEVILINQFDFSKAPTAQLFPTAVRTAGDAMTKAHNAKLLAAASQLHGTAGARVILVDVDRLFDDVFANPSSYGFANPGRPCLPDNGPPECASPSDADKRVFWDGTHLTSAAHKLVAAAVSGTRQAAIEAPRQVAVAGDLGLTLADTHRAGVEKHFGGALPLNGDGLSMSLTGEDGRQERADHVGRSGYRWDSRAFGIAIDQTIGRGVRVGLAGSRTTGDFSVSAGLGSGEATATSVSAFAAYKVGPFSSNVQLGRSWLDFEMERETGFTPAPKAQGKTSGVATFVDGSARYDIALGPLTLAPSGGLRWTRISVDGWQESSGGLMNVRAEQQKRQSLVASAGTRAEFSMPAGPLTIRPFASANYERELMDGQWTSAVVLGSGQRFALEAEPGDRKWVALEGGVTATLDERVAANLSYRTRAARDGDEERAYSVSLKYRF